MIDIRKLRAGDKIRRIGRESFDVDVGEIVEVKQVDCAMTIKGKVTGLACPEMWELVEEPPAYIRILTTEKQYHTSFITMTLEVDAEGERKLREVADNSQNSRRVATVDKKIAELEEELASYKEERERLSAEIER